MIDWRVPSLLWSGVRFEATGLYTAELLRIVGASQLRLKNICAAEDGFQASCTAKQYLRLYSCAKRTRTKLRVLQRRGLYFKLRRNLIRFGLWTGALAFFAMMLYGSSLVWYIDCPNMSVREQALALATLRGCGISVGTHLDGALLTKGETALLEADDTFAWASLNFAGGRLTIESESAQPVPTVREYRQTDLIAAAGGTVLLLDLQAGTPLVTPGQTVTAGQVLVAANRSSRAGAPVSGRTSGRVLAQLAWSCSMEQPLCYETEIPQMPLCIQRTYIFAGRAMTRHDAVHAFSAGKTRHYGLTFLGLALPVGVEETVFLPSTVQTVQISKTLSLAKARQASLRKLAQEWPDAQILALQENTEYRDNILNYTVNMQISADIAKEA